MANRRANKKLRALTRARMAATGESYQRALSQLRAQHASVQEKATGTVAVDLIDCDYYGVSVTLATFEDPILPRIVVLPKLHDQWQHQGTHLVWMRFLQARGVQ
jgi:hypothetical protein